MGPEAVWFRLSNSEAQSLGMEFPVDVESLLPTRNTVMHPPLTVSVQPKAPGASCWLLLAEHGSWLLPSWKVTPVPPLESRTYSQSLITSGSALAETMEPYAAVALACTVLPS